MVSWPRCEVASRDQVKVCKKVDHKWKAWINFCWSLQHSYPPHPSHYLQEYTTPYQNILLKRTCPVPSQCFGAHSGSPCSCYVMCRHIIPFLPQYLAQISLPVMDHDLLRIAPWVHLKLLVLDSRSNLTSFLVVKEVILSGREPSACLFNPWLGIQL